jgi:DNA-binding CsgD family transcriptional regulator
VVDKLQYAQVKDLLHLTRQSQEMTADTPGRRQHLLDGLTRIIGGDTAGLLDFEHTPEKGTAGSNLVIVGFDRKVGTEAFSIYNSAAGTIRNPALPAIGRMLRRGRVAVAPREAMIPDRDWYATEYVNDVRKRWRIDHSLYGVRVDEDGAAVALSFCRAWGRGPFSGEERALVELFLSEFGALLRPARDPWGPAAQRLPQRAREALGHVLRGLSDKEIAAAMGIGGHTVNQYLKAVFRALGVKSRAELIARSRAPR